MYLHRLITSGVARSLLLPVIVATSFSSFANDVFLRKPLSKGVYELAVNPQDSSVWVASSQGAKTDKGGIVYQLEPSTLEPTLVVHNDFKPFGVAINNQTQTLWLGNTVNSALTTIDTRTGDVKKRLILDDRQRSESVRPLQPREIAIDEKTNTVYISGIGKESVIWVVDGTTVKLKDTIKNTGPVGTSLALNSDEKRLYTTNGNGELIVIDTEKNKIISRSQLQDDGKEHLYLNTSLDKKNHQIFVTDSKEPEMLVVNTIDGKIIKKISVPESLSVLVNPARNEVYVTHRQAGKVSVIDATTYEIKKVFNTPVHPNSLALSADGNTLYVSVKQESSRQKEATQPDDIVRISL